MKVMTHIDGSQWSGRALLHACRYLDRADELVLLYVLPRGESGYVESGRMVLEACTRAAGLHRGREVGPGSVRWRLCVGKPREVISRVLEQEKADLLLMGALGVEASLPLSETRGTDGAMSERIHCPVVVCSPRGLELLLEEGRLMTQPRSELPRLSCPTPTVAPLSSCDAVSMHVDGQSLTGASRRGSARPPAHPALGAGLVVS